MSVLVFPQRKNLARTTLAASMDDSQGSVVVSNLADLKITDGNNFVWAAIVRAASYGTLTEPDNTEFVKITDVVSGTSTVSFDRGESDSTAITFSIGDYIEIRDPKDVIDYLQVLMDEVHTTADETAAAISNGLETLVVKEVIASDLPLLLTVAATLATSVVEGGILTVNGGDAGKYDISDGSGVILDAYSDPNNPTYTPVSWSGLTALTASPVPASFVAINSSGSLVSQAAPFSNSQRRTLIVLGAVGFFGGLIIALSNDFSVRGEAYLESDLARAIGRVNMSGNTFGAASTDLTIRKEAGTTFETNINYAVDKTDPHTKTSPSSDPATWSYIHSNGVPGESTLIPGQTDIDPTMMDDLSGSLVSSGGKWTNQYFYFFPDSGTTFLQYGQVQYDSLIEAKNAALTADFTSIGVNLTATVIRTVLSVKDGVSDLSDTSEVAFHQTAQFGLGSSGGSAPGTLLQDMQDTYNNSTEPEILTDTTRGAVTYRRGSLLDSDIVFEIQNGAGTTTFDVDGNGDVNMTDLFAEDGTFTGDIEAVGGTFTGNGEFSGGEVSVPVDNGRFYMERTAGAGSGSAEVKLSNTSDLFLTNISNFGGASTFIQTRNGTHSWEFDSEGNAHFGVTPTTTPNVNSDNLVVSASSHVGMTFNTETTAATLNLDFQDDVVGRFARIRSHGSTHANAEQLWFYSGGDILGLMLDGADAEIVGDITCIDLFADDGTFTGDVSVTGNLQFPTNATGLEHTLTGITPANLDFDFSNDSSSNSIVRLFRNTTTSTGGNKRVVLYNGTSTETLRLDAITGKIICGDVSAVGGEFSGEVAIENTLPTFTFNETDAALDEKIWKWRASGGALQLQSYTDADVLSTTFIKINRVGVSTNDIDLFGNTDITGTLEVTGDISGADIFATDGDFSGVINVGNATPVLTPSTQANTLVAANASHSGITVSTNTPAATTNIFFQDSVSGSLGRITCHGTGHANANQMWIYANGVVAMKLTANQDIAMTADLFIEGGALVLGKLQSVQGVMTIHASNAGEGAQINMQGSTTGQNWVMDVDSSTNYRLFSNTATDTALQVFNAGAGVTDINMLDGDLNISVGDINVTLGDITTGGDITADGRIIAGGNTADTTLTNYALVSAQTGVSGRMYLRDLAGGFTTGNSAKDGTAFLSDSGIFRIFGAKSDGSASTAVFIELDQVNADIEFAVDMTIVGGLLVSKQTRYSAQTAITTAWDIEANPSVKQTMSANRTVTISNQAVNSNGVFTVTFGGTLFTLGFAATGGSVTFHGSGSPTYAINTVYVISVYFYNATDCYISVIGEGL